VKARIKFQKYGSMKFISHLDVMRYFQKLFRRAEIDNEFTKGYSPHPIMSFAAPLGVGLTSDSEYLDVELKTADTSEIMIKRMNDAATEGFKIIGFHPLLDREENQKAVTAMSLVSSADYLVSLKDGYSLAGIPSKKDLKEQFQIFLNSPEIVIDKKTKNSEKAVNIKPMITLAAFEENEYKEKLKTVINAFSYNDQMQESVAEQYENGRMVYLQLDTGSSVNLKPELVIEAFYDFLSIPFEKFAWQVHRLEVYTRDTESGKSTPLDHLER
jgi:radical SAM-linked protein